MSERCLPDRDEYITVKDALLLIRRRTNISREAVELDLHEEYENGKITLQDEESMSVRNPSRHLDSTRKRVIAAIKSSPISAIAETLYISLEDFAAIANGWLDLYEDVEELFEGYGPEGDGPTTYTVENEFGYTILGAARALAKKFPVSEGAMAERIFDAAKQGRIRVRDPYTGLVYVPKSHRYQHERVSVSDLNQWLEESDVSYRLGDDSAEVATATAATGHRDIDRGQVMRIFSVEPTADMNRKFWDERLGRPPEWLRAARTFVGRPGVSSRWSPLLVAHALLGDNRMKLRQLDAAFHEHLPELLEQWREETEDQRQSKSQ